MQNKELLKEIIQNNKAHNAIIKLYKNNFDEDLILELISLGQLGEEGNKKSLPIKMANTMYDKTISEFLVEEIKKFKLIENYEIFNSNMYDNDFVIILFPQEFSLEFIEKSPTMWDEFDYVEYGNKLQTSKPETAGAFYSVQLGVLEYLMKEKKQASIMIIRNMKLNEGIGAKKLREVIRKMQKKNNFNSLNNVSNYLKKNFPNHFKKFKESQIMKKINEKKLDDYF